MTTTTQYAKACNKCGQPILMKQSGGKWAAFEADGLNTHACGQNQKTPTPQNTPANPTIQPNPSAGFMAEFETTVRRLAREEARKVLMEAKN